MTPLVGTRNSGSCVPKPHLPRDMMEAHQLDRHGRHDVPVVRDPVALLQHVDRPVSPPVGTRGTLMISALGIEHATSLGGSLLTASGRRFRMSCRPCLATLFEQHVKITQG